MLSKNLTCQLKQPEYQITIVQDFSGQTTILHKGSVLDHRVFDPTHQPYPSRTKSPFKSESSGSKQSKRPRPTEDQPKITLREKACCCEQQKGGTLNFFKRGHFYFGLTPLVEKAKVQFLSTPQELNNKSKWLPVFIDHYSLEYAETYGGISERFSDRPPAHEGSPLEHLLHDLRKR